MRPSTLAFDPKRRPPEGYDLDLQVRKGLVIGGAVTFGSLVVVSSISATILLDEEAGAAAALFVPVVGPFIAAGTLEATVMPSVLLALDGVGQVVGLGLLIAGATQKRPVWVLRPDSYVRIDVEPVAVASDDGGFAGLRGSF